MSRYGPLPTPRYTWPQDKLQIPNSGSGLGSATPPVGPQNALVVERESFAMSGTFALGAGTAAPNTVFNLSIPTDQDGDFWCTQIYMVAWFNGAGGFAQSARLPPSTIDITDFRTGKKLTYPGPVNTNFLTTLLLFSDDIGFDPASSPLPDGFRSTATLPQPFCFTRQGGIQLALTILPQLGPPTPIFVDIGFGGWKEYAHAG